MILYKNTKVNIFSPDGDTDFFDIAAGILQGDILGLYLPRLHTSNVNRSNERKWLYTKRQEADDTLHKLSRTQTTQMTVLLANTPAQA